MKALFSPWLIIAVLTALLLGAGAGFHIGGSLEAAACQRRSLAAVTAEEKRVEGEAAKADKIQDVEISTIDQVERDIELKRKESDDAARTAGGADRLCLDADGVRRLNRR
jgi:Sec-independent protein translocase protein TatA